MSSTETDPSGDALTVQVDEASIAVDVPLVGPGRTLGRYIVVEELGRGGMGIVYRGYDPKLRREVALKVLRLAVRAPGHEEAEARLLREAQAMAQLSHPNVLPVYDVEVIDAPTTDGQGRPVLFIAMEYVEGTPLRDWIAAGPRTWREVLSVMIPAGRGLAAAHAAGLVHRDFKPANVLVGREGAGIGRVRVMDFGLARLAENADGSGPLSRSQDVPVLRGASDDLAHTSLDQDLTQAGTVIGTPAYMAPEHHAGRSLDARSDVYGFCVTLFEALVGVRPFQAKTADALAQEKRRGPPAFPPERRIPGWLAQACRRGLEPDPARRYASMSELLTVLERDPDRGRRLAVGAIAAAALVGLGAAGVWSAELREGPCDHAGEGFDEAWSFARQRAVADTLTSLQIPYLRTSASRVDEALEAYRVKWSDARVAACEATHVEHAWTADLLDRAMMCLDERRDLARATIDAIVGATEEEVARKAVGAALELPSVDVCGDVEFLRATIAPPVEPALAQEVAQLRRELSEMDALMRSGQLGPALPIARDLLERAQAVAYPPVRVEARRRLGEALNHAGKHDEARDELVAAYFDALAVGHDREAVATSTTLVYVLGSALSQSEQAISWGKHADALIERTGDRDGSRARLVLNLGSTAMQASDLDTAIARIGEALELHREIYGEDDPRYAVVHSNLGIALGRAGDHAAAIEHYERAIAVLEASLGEDHPEVAMPLVNLGSALSSQGEFDRALVVLRRALAIWEPSLGRDHPRVATVLNNIGTVLQDQGKDDAALDYHLQALEIRRRVLGEQNLDVAMSLNNIANIRWGRGDLEGSEQGHRRALEIRQTVLGADHPITAMSAFNLGTVLLDRERLPESRTLVEGALKTFRDRLGADHPHVALGLTTLSNVERAQGELEGAMVHAREALALQERSFGSRHFHVAEALTNLARLQREQGRLDDARLGLERALEILESDEDQPQRIGRARFELARTLAAQRDRAAAVTMAELALEAYERAESLSEQRAEIEAWLATHRSRGARAVSRDP